MSPLPVQLGEVASSLKRDSGGFQALGPMLNLTNRLNYFTYQVIAKPKELPLAPVLRGEGVGG